ncbi:IS5/IS1182 family transposase, partial [Cytobacillus firmus]|nr:IS5/IS1182 family transposase [Cytobacillus firmus]
KYHKGLMEKSNQLYNELLKNEIIPEMERETDEQLSVEELAQLVQKVDEVVTEYDKKIEATSDIPERKALRSERKYPKQVRKQLIDFV